MVQIENLRSYLLSDPQLQVLLENNPAIFLLQKSKEIDYETFIVYLYKPLTGGQVKDYQVEFRIIGKNLSKLVAIQSRLIKLLDENYTIDGIYMTKLLNGGGMIFNPEDGNSQIVVFFMCKI